VPRPPSKGLPPGGFRFNLGAYLRKRLPVHGAYSPSASIITGGVERPSAASRGELSPWSRDRLHPNRAEAIGCVLPRIDNAVPEPRSGLEKYLTMLVPGFRLSKWNRCRGLEGAGGPGNSGPCVRISNALVSPAFIGERDRG
jgi:hypothetical protein